MARFVLWFAAALSAAAATVPAADADTPALLRRTWVRAPRPALPVAPAAAAPTIDGDLSDAAWTTASETSAFPLTRDTLIRAALLEDSEAPTRVWVARDAGHLYLAFRCDEPDPSKIRSSPDRKRDDGLSADDTLEVFLAADDNDVAYLHLTVNPDGVLRDTREHFGRTGEQVNWDSAGRFAAKRTPAGWAVEMAVPLREIAGDAPADAERVVVGNFVRRRWAGAVGVEPETVAWTGSPGPDRLGRLVFSTVAVKTPALPVLSLGTDESRWEVRAPGPASAGDPPTLVPRAELSGRLRESRRDLSEAVPARGKVVRIEQRWTVAEEGLGHLSLMLMDPRFPDAPVACVQRALWVPSAAGRLAETRRRLARMPAEALKSGAADPGGLEAELRRVAAVRDRLVAGRPTAGSAEEWTELSKRAETLSRPFDESFDRWADGAARRRLTEGTRRAWPTAGLAPAAALQRLAAAMECFVVPPSGTGPAPAPAKPAPDVADLRFWEAADALAEAAGWRLDAEDAPVRLTAVHTESPPGERPAYASPPRHFGALRLLPRRLQITHNFEKNEPSVNFRVLLNWEPGVSVLALSGEPEVLSASDNAGRSLKPAGTAALPAVMPGGAARKDWRVPIQVPAPGATAIRGLKLSAELTVAGAVDRWEFPDLSAEPDPVAAGGVFVRPSRIERSDDRLTLTVEIDAGEAVFFGNVREGPDLYPAVRLVWLDADGRPMPLRQEQENVARRVSVYQLTVRPDPAGRLPRPGRLIVEYPRTAVRERMTFDVGDVILP